MLSQLSAQTNFIKEETFIEMTFTDKFIQIVSNLEFNQVVSKDSIFQFVRLFYQDNSLFLELFQKTFLLIFQTYTSGDNRIHRFMVQDVVKGYSQLLNLFLTEMINMEFQVKKPEEQQDYFQNFVDFYLQFFGEGLMSGKSFIKDFSFTMITFSLRLIEEHLELELFPETQNQLLQSALFLITSKLQDYKRMGIELYTVLKKINIKSQEINEILIQYLESLQNFNLRRMIIIWGIDLKLSESLNRILNRLKDKNPLICQQIVQKMITQKIFLKNLTFEQKMKLIVDGYGSHHQNVKKKTLTYFSKYFLDILNEPDLKTIENQTTDFSSFNMSYSILQIVEKPTKIQRWIGMFNYDNYADQNTDIFKQNPFVSALICDIVFDLSHSLMSFEQIKTYIQLTFNKIYQSQIKCEQIIYVYSILKGIAKGSKKNLKSENIESLKSYILSQLQIPEAHKIVSLLRKIMKQKRLKQNITLISYILKFIQLLVIQIDIYDCVGKRAIYDQLRQSICEIKLFNSFSGDISMKSQKQNNIETNQKLLSLDLIVFNKLVGQTKRSFIGSHQPVTNPTDLILLIVDIIGSILQKESTCQTVDFKLMIDQLIQNKQLYLEKETIKNMCKKTQQEINHSQQNTIDNNGDKKSLVHLIDIKKQIQKKLRSNQRQIIVNTIKAFIVLSKILSIKQSFKYEQKNVFTQYVVLKYMQHIKNYLYKIADNLHLQNEENMSICCYPFLILYHHCSQNVSNFQQFKKLFVYYAFEQIHNLSSADILLKLVNTRILIQLQNKFTKQGQNDIKQRQQQHIYLQKEIQNYMLKQSIDSFEQYFLKQIILKSISQISQKQLSNYYLSKFLILGLKQYFSNPLECQFSKIFIIIYQQITLLNPDFGFESLLISYNYIHSMINDCNINLKRQQKNVILVEINKILQALMKMNIKLNHSQYNEDQISIVMLKFISVLKMFQNEMQQTQSLLFEPIKLKQSFSILCNKKQGIKQIQLQVPYKSHFSRIQLQLLIYTKSTIENVLVLLKNKAKTEYSNDIAYLLETLDIIEENLSQQITKRLYQKEINHYDQQSTGHSLIQNNNKNQIKINDQKIQSYKGQMAIKINQLKTTGQRIFNQVKNTKFYQQLCKQLSTFVSLIIKQKKLTDNYQSDTITKLQEIKQISNQQGKLNEKINIKNIEFDRKGRRKEVFNQKPKQSEPEMKVKIKRSRYLIIPYDIIEEVEQKQKIKKKCSKNIPSNCSVKFKNFEIKDIVHL